MKLWPFTRSKPAEQAQQPRTRRFPLNRLAARMFTGANVDRFGTGWGTQPLTADDVINKNQRILVARSREQAANNDYGKKFLRMCRNNIVGPKGVLLQAKSTDNTGKLDTLANEAIELAFAAWGHKKNCDVTGKLSWRAMQAACVNSAAKDGEFFLRLVFGADAGPWGFALQLLDPQRCPVDMVEDRLPSGNFIRQGIEFNRYGRPIAYYFSTVDESDDNYHWGGRDFVRIPADEILHGFFDDMVGQKRGLPWMATSLFRMRQLAGMEESALVNARAGANKMGFVEWDEGAAGGPEWDEDDDLVIDSEPGEFQVLPMGARIKEWSPQYPNGEFAGFTKQMLRGMASGMGVAYNNLANDLEGVNFSSIRQGTLDERESWKELQEWLIENLHQPVFEAWLPRALLSGRITVKGRSLKPERIDRYSVVEWQPRRWAWIDPSADVTAAEKSKNNMLQSPGRIIREGGSDPNTVWKETARDMRSMVDELVAQGFDEKDAKTYVLHSMGQDKTLLTGQQNAEKPSE